MDNGGSALLERFPAMSSWDFRRIFVNGFFTTGSRWAQVLARGWLVHELSGGSTGAVGIVTFASFIPFVVVGPFAGAIADRFNRRRLLIWATVFGVAGATVLATITIADIVEVWHVVVLAFATGSAQAATVPTRQALIANVVPTEHLLNAIALGGISQHGSRVIGPLFGAAFLNTLGAGSVFLVSAVLLVFGLIEAIRIRYRPARDSATDIADSTQGNDELLSTVARRLVGDLASAGRYVRADRRLLTAIGLVGAHCSLTMAFDSMMPALSEKVGGSATLYSAILIGLGAGAIAGTITVSQLRRDRTRGAIFAGVGFGSGLAMAIMGAAVTPIGVVIGAILAGLTQASYMTMSASLVQSIVSDEYRGRVMSFYIMIAAGHMAILNLGYGRLAEIIDVRILLVVPGLAWILVLGVALGSMGEVRSLVRRGRFTSMAEALPLRAS
ncbi:MAG: MFS transporter [Actinomycetia bacterium]|nr:MFS transporter [Actinomycetes bacterium]MCP5032645.1 MFS transporter [Actinomycetes bacterium]